MSERRVLWQPNPGPQTRFLASTANEVLYGGAAGGGKSAASVALPLRWVNNGDFRCLFLRREAKYLSDAIDKSTKLYPHFGARLVKSPKIIWTFPSGAQVWLNHCEHEKDVANYDSLEFHLVIFEELTHFTEPQYRGIRARIRGTDPTLPRFSRATSNPGGPGHDWVFARFGAWLDPKHHRPAKPGETRWYSGDDEVQRGAVDSLSRQFIPATLADNPYVTSEYRAQLLDTDPVRRRQLLEGDWLAQPGKGMYFKRRWFPLLDAAPTKNLGPRVRAWDLGATVDGDWTVGVLMRKMLNGTYVVEHVARFRGTPADVDAQIKRTAETDGKATPIVLPQDPGQAGVAQVAAFRRLLAGWTVHFARPTGDKVTRAGGYSTQCEGGNVSLVAGEWTNAYLDELEAFPESKWDDQVDASADAFNWLVRGNTVKRSDGNSGDASRTMEGWA